MNLERREINVRPEDLFPNYDFHWVVQEFGHCGNGDEDKTVFETARDLASRGYRKVFDKFGFWEKDKKGLAGHCHQFTPALGIVLGAMGYDVTYLEGYRIDDEHLVEGNLVRVDPHVEQGPLREEFIRIGRIPYCVLEVKVRGAPKFISPKHLTVDDEGTALAGLTDDCYEFYTGVFPHQYEPRRSGIYLHRDALSIRLIRPQMVIGFDPEIFPLWMKQKIPRPGEEREPMERFATYLRMNILSEN